MNRREFLESTAVAAGVGSLGAPVMAQESASAAPQYYELRLFHLRNGPMGERYNTYMKEAFIPAANRAGIEPVGAFNVMLGPDSPTSYVLLPHKNIESVSTLYSKLDKDKEYQKAAAPFRSLPATDPGYIRMDSSLMVAFPTMPMLEKPKGPAAAATRIFELRTYESHSKSANKKKIEMFGPGGEIGIFKKVGFSLIFFGENLIGQRLPSLTYMVAFEDMAARDRGWAAFGNDPDWKKLRETPGYSNLETVSNIHNAILRPAGYSQI
jgi:hypothetical protein